MYIGFDEAGEGEWVDSITIVNGLSHDLVVVGILGFWMVAALVQMAPDFLIEVDDGGLVSIERGLGFV